MGDPRHRRHGLVQPEGVNAGSADETDETDEQASSQQGSVIDGGRAWDAPAVQAPWRHDQQQERPATDTPADGDPAVAEEPAQDGGSMPGG